MGLGKKLLQELDKLGVVFHMEKIMLTVFKGTLTIHIQRVCETEAQ